MKGFIRAIKTRQIACFSFGSGGYYATQEEAHKAALEWIGARKDKASLTLETVVM